MNILRNGVSWFSLKLLLFFIFMNSVFSQNAEGLLPVLKELMNLAEKGSVPAQYQLGNFYFGIKGDNIKACEWYKRAADKGLAEAQVALAIMYLEGYSEKGSGQPDRKTARKYFLLAAEQGNPEAMAQLASLHGDDNDEANDAFNEKEAFKWMEKARTHGYLEDTGHDELIYRDMTYSSSDNLKKTTDWYEKAAQEGDIYAANTLGIRYAKGRGVSRDKQKALEWFDKAAKKDCADGQYNLALLLASGAELSFLQKVGLAKREEDIVYQDRPRACRLFMDILRHTNDDQNLSLRDPEGLRASILYYLLKFRFTEKEIAQAKSSAS